VINCVWGKNTEIAWRGSIDIGSVDIKIRNGNQGKAVSIGSYPVSFNEYGLDNGEGVVIWKAGAFDGIFLNEGFSYQLIMQGIYPIKPEDRLYGTAADFHQAGGFSIINCSG